jgi:hypothetical protein
MVRQLTLYPLACGPALLMLATWFTVLIRIRRENPTLLGVIALAVATANAALAAGIVLHYEAGPEPYLPPWKNPEILNLAMLFFLAPVGIGLAMWARSRGAPKWLAWTVGLGSLPLLLIGGLAGVSV